MKNAAQTSASAFQRRGSGPAVAVMQSPRGRVLPARVGRTNGLGTVFRRAAGRCGEVVAKPAQTAAPGAATLTAGDSGVPRGEPGPEPARLEGSVAEVATACEDHRRARRLDRCDDLLVALRAAGLDDRRDAGLERELRPVREREERVGRKRRARYVVSRLPRFLERDPHRVDTALLTRADPDRAQLLREHD